jgi:hypothetical protein
MFKTIVALALFTGAASTALAAPKTLGTNPTYDVYSTNGQYLGSDPDPHVRSMLARDPTGSD